MKEKEEPTKVLENVENPNLEVHVLGEDLENWAEIQAQKQEQWQKLKFGTC